MIRYIQRKDLQFNDLETVDELNKNDFNSFIEFRKELNRLRIEYNLIDSSACYYTSQRACKDWNN